MCGIAGVWSKGNTDVTLLRDRVRRAQYALKHRGPDDHGEWVDNENGLILVHRRLSVIDLTVTGRQPLVSGDGNVSIVYNGEIYNYLELRKILISQGFIFKGTSDTEVLLNLYRSKGIDCVYDLRGMYAFAIWDKRTRTLFLARDKVGKKPLYYSLNGGFFSFASELNALRLLADRTKFTINNQSILEYLNRGAIGGSNTIYSEIKELPPGNYAVIKDNKDIRIKKYWRIDWEKKERIKRIEAIDRINETLRTAISMRLRSDVPIGLFLSGGIDSGLIAAISSEIHNGKLETFTIGFDESEFDERSAAKSVSKYLSTNHHEAIIRPNVVSDLPKIVASYGEPLADPSIIPSHLIAKFASKYVKVVLNGDGGDEVFCGYRRHLAANLIDVLHKIVSEEYSTKMAKHLLNIIPGSSKSRSMYGFFYRVLRSLAVGKKERLNVITFDGLNDYEQSMFIREDIRRLPRSYEIDYGLKDNNANLSELVYLLKADFENELSDILLVKMDIATMAYGVEARSPFLDTELIEFAFSIPDNRKVSFFHTKPLLRSLAEKYLPKEICDAPKKGFEIPLVNWLKGDLKEMSRDLILSKKGICEQVFKIEQLEKLLCSREKFNIDEYRWAKIVWNLLILAIWDDESRKLYDKKDLCV